MTPGILLVHGYSGSPENLRPLADALAEHFGEDSVANLALPCHDGNKTPEFNEVLFTEAILRKLETFEREKRNIVVIGHSTGGSLALAALRRFSAHPDLLILLAVPRSINRDYFERWETHREGKTGIPLTDVAQMIKLINSAGSNGLDGCFPVLIVHGAEDRLVPPEEAAAWKGRCFPRTGRVVQVPGAGHHLLDGPQGPWVIDLVRRAVADQFNAQRTDPDVLDSLTEADPGIRDFLEFSPSARYHLASCPGARRVVQKKPALAPMAASEPVLANIEITTYCNLNCSFCARSQLNKANKHMSFERFREILALLPHIYKVVLVGLGEPLIHPEVADFVAYAKSLKKKVGLVTNAMLLDREIASKLLEARLDSIAFSIDGYDAVLSSQVRQGTDFDTVIRNIQTFTAIARSYPATSKAVFSAVSIDTVFHLRDLMERVSTLGVDVIMLSDINFGANLAHTLWKNRDERVEEAVRRSVTYAFSKKLPVLSVRGLEEFGLEKRYHDSLLIPPAQLYERSVGRTWCLSPWQTLPIDVEGRITLCDCQPSFVLGDLFRDPFSRIWNGEPIQKYRAEMLSRTPPEACAICPRF